MFLPDEANVILTLPSSSLPSFSITQLEKSQQLRVHRWQEITAQAGFCSLPQGERNLASLKDNSLLRIINRLPAERRTAFYPLSWKNIALEIKI